MLLTIIISLTIFYSGYKYYNIYDNREEIEEGRRYKIIVYG